MMAPRSNTGSLACAFANAGSSLAPAAAPRMTSASRRVTFCMGVFYDAHSRSEPGPSRRRLALMNGMDGIADRHLGSVMGLTGEIEREFEARLAESSTLAFRVAYGVLRHRQDAEDVAQDAFVKAYRNFRQLRDRDRFRAWLVRMTWRLAIDRWRSDRRRSAREDV